MLIEKYFTEIETRIADSIYVQKSKLIIDKRSSYIGFIDGEIDFIDGSKLYFIEFVETKEVVNLYKYSYHYQNKKGEMIFRYDMAPHHKELSSFPHHKHIMEEGGLLKTLESRISRFSDVLDEIEEMISLSRNMK